MSFEILGVDLYHILSWFIVYSFMGWIWESCYVSAKSKKLGKQGICIRTVCNKSMEWGR